MSFKYVGILVLVSSIALGCNQNTADESVQTDDTEHQAPQQQSQTTGQNPQNAQPAQPAGQNTLQAQPTGGTVDDAELKQFVAASQIVQKINQEAQQEMQSAVEKVGLPAQRFMEIRKAQQNPNQQANATEEELKKFEVASQQLAKIQSEATKKMQEKVSAEGLTETRFQEISVNLRKNPELQKRFRAIQQQGN